MHRSILLLVVVAATAACSTLLGLGDYHETPSSGPSDAQADTLACGDVDLTKQCYACAPQTNAQFLNSCTGATCVPFDDSRVTKLLPDGGLPPVPAGDGSI